MPTTGATDPTLPDDAPRDRAQRPLDISGYHVTEVIGHGGMGEVVLAEDERIGRPVAIKRILGEPSPEATARFLREARIQARLEHPAIVPAHELGHDADGRPYFTMKRLAGTTLADVLARGTTGTNELLRGFVDICLALDFAHARGVVHRDMKPANIMLGDYGEVYVLDWGVARVLADADASASGSLGDIALGDSQTQAGAILGTPAYMAPEQLNGEPVGPEADVYALGGILFQLLAGEPANTRTGVLVDAPSPSARRPERAIAPELDAICCAALAVRPDDRPTARQLADRVRAYLDGDRDVALRRTLGDAQLELARGAIASGDPARRADAMAAAGRALALDPSSVDAAALVTQLILEPPRVMPDSLAKRLDDRDRSIVESQGQVAAKNLAAYLGFIPLAIWVGIRDWGVMSALWAFNVVLMVGAIAMARRMIRHIGWAVLGNAVALALATRMFGSFVVLPALIVNASVSLIAHPTVLHKPARVVGAMLAAFLVPLALEAAGLWERTWWLTAGTVVTRPTAIDLTGTPAAVYLVLGGAAIIVATSLYVRSIALAQRAAQRQLDIQAWHLEQLLPARPVAAM